MCARINQLLHFLRRLRVYGIDGNIMLFYKATIESIVRYAISTWFGNLSLKLKARFTESDRGQEKS